MLQGDNIILDRAEDFSLYVSDPDGDAVAAAFECVVPGLFTIAAVPDAVNAGEVRIDFTAAHALALGDRSHDFFIRQTAAPRTKFLEGQIWAEGVADEVMP